MRGPRNYTQTDRFISFETVLGSELLVRSFSGRDAVSSIFVFDLDLLSENDGIDLKAVLGTNGTLRLRLADGSARYWNGHISRITQGWRGPVFTSYRAELVPWLWFLGLRHNSKIFQQESVSDIVRDVFSAVGFRDFDFRLRNTPPKREYCVQYRETDLHFIMRLLEEEGIVFFFEHSNGRHKLVLTDNQVGYPICENQATVSVRKGAGGRWDKDFISDWREEKDYIPSGSALTDYNFKTPKLDLYTRIDGSGPFEIYDHPGIYDSKSRGQDLNKTRFQETQVHSTSCYGEGNCRVFNAGHRFQLRDHYRHAWNQWYVLTELQHHATQAGNFLGDEEPVHGETAYRNDFVCIPYETYLRPIRRTPIPVIEGCQTAFVVGPQGDEIYTDEFGRVKVQFHWDRYGQLDERSSCWIRVAQSLAGQRWGGIAIPRVGQEVIVTFLDGNPDRPLITGCVYNSAAMPPYVLPDNKDIVGLKTDTTKGSGGYNEIALKDAKGGELVRVHAQKDMDTIVLHDGREIVKNNKNVHVFKELRTEVDDKVSHTVKGDVVEQFMKNHAEVVADERLLSARRLVIEASEEICIKVGGNHVSISAAGVQVEGTLVKINCEQPPANTTLKSLTPSSPDDPSDSSAGEKTPNPPAPTSNVRPPLDVRPIAFVGGGTAPLAASTDRRPRDAQVDSRILGDSAISERQLNAVPKADTSRLQEADTDADSAKVTRKPTTDETREISHHISRKEYQAAIDKTISYYGIDVSKVKNQKMTYSATLTDANAETGPDRATKIGPSAVQHVTPGRLAATLTHEATHANQIHKHGFPHGQSIAAYEAMGYEAALKHADTLKLTQTERDWYAEKVSRYRNSLSKENQKKYDEGQYWDLK